HTRRPAAGDLLAVHRRGPARPPGGGGPCARGAGAGLPRPRGGAMRAPMTRRASKPAGLVLAAALLLPGRARADGPADRAPPALFALIVGVNRSVDPELAPLSYADDDA